MAQPEGDVRQLVLSQHEPDGPHRAVRDKAQRVASQLTREPPDPRQHAGTRAAVRASADRADHAPHAPEQVPAPGVKRDRKGAVQDDRANVLGVPRGVHRHQERAVRIAPQIQLVETQRRAYGTESRPFPRPTVRCRGDRSAAGRDRVATVPAAGGRRPRWRSSPSRDRPGWRRSCRQPASWHRYAPPARSGCRSSRPTGSADRAARSRCHSAYPAGHSRRSPRRSAGREATQHDRTDPPRSRGMERTPWPCHPVGLAVGLAGCATTIKQHRSRQRSNH